MDNPGLQREDAPRRQPRAGGTAFMDNPGLQPGGGVSSSASAPGGRFVVRPTPDGKKISKKLCDNIAICNFCRNFATQTVSRKPGYGSCGRVMLDYGPCRPSDIYEKRLLDALSWLVETWKISCAVRNETEVDDYADMYFTSVSARALSSVFTHILREASALSVLLHGQFQGLNKRNGQEVRLSRFFCLSPFIPMWGARRCFLPVICHSAALILFFI